MISEKSCTHEVQLCDASSVACLTVVDAAAARRAGEGVCRGSGDARPNLPLAAPA